MEQQIELFKTWEMKFAEPGISEETCSLVVKI